MKATIYTPGDSSVGIPDGQIDVDFHDYKFDDPDERKAVRRQLEEFGSDFSTVRSYVIFSDECPDCGEIREDGKPCPRENCISNMEEPA